MTAQTFFADEEEAAVSVAVGEAAEDDRAGALDDELLVVLLKLLGELGRVCHGA